MPLFFTVKLHQYISLLLLALIEEEKGGGAFLKPEGFIREGGRLFKRQDVN